MLLAEVTSARVQSALNGPGLDLVCGRFTFKLRSPHREVADGLQRMYPAHALAEAQGFVDYEISIDRGRSLRRWMRPQARFVFDGHDVFEPMPASHAYPLMEWAMNWCVTSHVMDHLSLHAAVLERGGRALILPAPPGSGKSTLCAGLMHAGWRLLSDEVTMLDLNQDLAVSPHCRPVSLKNDSIAIIGAFAQGRAVFNEVSHQTIKGNVAHMRPMAEHVARGLEPAMPAWIVFPRWRPGAEARLTPAQRAGGLVRLADNAFNFHMLGTLGFEALATVAERCRFFDFEYARLADAVRVFDALAAGD